MPDIRSYSFPFSSIAGFSGAGDTFLTLAGTSQTAWPVLAQTTLTGRLYSMSATNRDTATRYLQIWCGSAPYSPIVPIPSNMGTGTIASPFSPYPVMQFELAGATQSSGAVLVPGVLTMSREFFGASGLEFVGPNLPAGSRSKLPVAVYNSVSPSVCGFCIAISTTPNTYTAATPSEHDLQGMMGA